MNYHHKIRNLILIGILCFFFIHTSYTIWVYFFTDVYPSDQVGILYQLIIYVAVIYAILHDNKIGDYVYETYDFGLIAWVFWPIFIPFYLYKSRGIMALPILLVLFIVLFIESIVNLGWILAISVEA